MLRRALVDGTCEIVAYARATMTGLRESILMNKLMPANPGRDPGELMPTQEQIDDPSADVGIDPLSQVRAALAWLLDQSGLEVTTPMPAPVDGEVELTRSSCVVTPPRFLLASHLRMSPTLSVFMRTGIPRASGRLSGSQSNSWIACAQPMPSWCEAAKVSRSLGPVSAAVAPDGGPR